MKVIERPNDHEFPPFTKSYVERVPGDDVVQVLAGQIGNTIALLRGVGEERSQLAYAPGKWTVKQVIGHMSDAERIFSYRALRIARGDGTPLPGFEQDDYVPNAGSNERTLDNLLAELAVVRQSTLALVRALPPEAWLRSGTASGFPCTVRGIVFALAGHELHHYDILESRYGTGTTVGGN